MLAKLGDLDFLWLLSGVRMIRARIHLQLAIHRIAHLRLWEHAAHGFLYQTHGLPLPHIDGTLFAQATFIAAVPAVDLLFFLAAGQLHRSRVDNDDVIARVDKWGIGRLVLALQQTNS